MSMFKPLERVVILGAGTGSRLRPITDDRPKCAVALAGEPLAVRALRQFADRGVRRGTVVVGHFADRARELIGARVGEMTVDFVDNPEYDTTNTMYSTLLAADALRQGAYLVEGDIACSDVAIERLMTTADAGLSLWAGEPWTDAHSGCQIRTDAHGRIVQQSIVRNGVRDGARPPDDGLRTWKSAGMLRITARDAAVLIARLEAEAGAGNRRVYYDDVIGKHVGDFDLRVCDLQGVPWVEIDDLDDMAQARTLFEEPL